MSRQKGTEEEREREFEAYKIFARSEVTRQHGSEVTAQPGRLGEQEEKRGDKEVTVGTARVELHA